MSFCKDCISGVKHDGTPVGKLEKIGGVETYVAIPEIDYPKDKAVLFLPDVFGHTLVNAQLLADDFARNGFQVYIPDYLNGDPIAPDAFGKPDFDIMKWFANHGYEQTRPPLDAVINALKAKGITTFAATGYCFGGKYAVILAQENGVKAISISHPSLLDVPGDFDKILATSHTAVQINSCEVDTQFPHEKQEITDKLLGDGKYKHGYKRAYFPGCTHGFAVRGDLSDPKVKAGKEGAFKEAVEWFINHL